MAVDGFEVAVIVGVSAATFLVIALLAAGLLKWTAPAGPDWVDHSGGGEGGVPGDDGGGVFTQSPPPATAASAGDGDGYGEPRELGANNKGYFDPGERNRPAPPPSSFWPHCCGTGLKYCGSRSPTPPAMKARERNARSLRAANRGCPEHGRSWAPRPRAPAPPNPPRCKALHFREARKGPKHGGRACGILLLFRAAALKPHNGSALAPLHLK